MSKHEYPLVMTALLLLAVLALLIGGRSEPAYIEPAQHGTTSPAP